MGSDRRDDVEARYCSQCGDGLAPSMNYCPNCGTAIDHESSPSKSGAAKASGTSKAPGSSKASTVSKNSATSSRRSTNRSGRTRRTDVDADTRRRLESRIAHATRDGWELERDFGNHVVMVRRTFGSADTHLVIALFTIWWTMGLANVLYGAYSYVEGAERMVLHGKRRDEADPEDATDTSLLAWVAAGLCWLTAAIIGAIGVSVGLPALSLVLFALAFLFVVVGLSAFPSVRDRVARRHSITTNGKTRSVDERAVVAHDRPCTACAEPVGRGVERTYRSEFCVLGVPITGSAGRNYYCRACANGERSGAEQERVTTDPDTETEEGDSQSESEERDAAPRADDSMSAAAETNDPRAAESRANPESEPDLDHTR